jgi:hypothetical protein
MWVAWLRGVTSLLSVGCMLQTYSGAHQWLPGPFIPHFVPKDVGAILYSAHVFME